jgi:hypothetical protein
MIRMFLILVLLAFKFTSFSQEHNAELISHKTIIEIKNGRLFKEYYSEIRINNRAGEKHTKIEIPHSKLIKVKSIKAYIKDSKGRTVKKLKKSEINEKSSISVFSFYEDNLVKEFTLKHNTYPYTIVYSYQVQQKEFLYIDYWNPIIDEKTPTHFAHLMVSAPLDYNISFNNLNVGKPIIDTLENRIKYQWETSYTGIIKPEVFSPPVSNFLPAVKIVPREFYFDKKGSFYDWISFGNWQYDLLQGLNELPENEKGKIQSLINNIDDDKEKIKILYHYLQDETRYINVTIETGGLKPYPAIYVAQNKYGDCKALTNYFKSALDYIQIPSYYTKVYAGNPIREINKDFPSQQSNHIILYIPLGDEVIWLDCTSDGAFDYLGTFTQNRDAFIIDYDNSRFIKTPTLEPKDVLVTRKIAIKYNLIEATVRFKNTYKGDSYENILHLEKNFNESEKFKIVRNYIVPEGFQLINYQTSNLDRDSVKIELSYEAISQDLYRNYGNEILVNNIAFALPNFERPKIRQLPVQIDYPVYKIDTVIYDIPVGYQIHKGLDNYSLINKYGEFNFNIYENDDNITIIKSLLINSGYYPVSEYAEFYDFYKQVVEMENKTHVSLFK